jgi:hypothetical protein
MQEEGKKKRKPGKKTKGSNRDIWKMTQKRKERIVGQTRE